MNRNRILIHCTFLIYKKSRRIKPINTLCQGFHELSWACQGAFFPLAPWQTPPKSSKIFCVQLVSCKDLQDPCTFYDSLGEINMEENDKLYTNFCFGMPFIYLHPSMSSISSFCIDPSPYGGVHQWIPSNTEIPTKNGWWLEVYKSLWLGKPPLGVAPKKLRGNRQSSREDWKPMARKPSFAPTRAPAWQRCSWSKGSILRHGEDKVTSPCVSAQRLDMMGYMIYIYIYYNITVIFIYIYIYLICVCMWYMFYIYTWYTRYIMLGPD